MLQFIYLKILLGSSPGAVQSLISQKIIIEQGRDAYEGGIMDSQLYRISVDFQVRSFILSKTVLVVTSIIQEA